MTNQTYEEYWSITNAFTDYDGDKFLWTLRICIEFIEKNSETNYSDEKYNSLQKEIETFNPINLISIRKWVNQLVKFGFIKPYLSWFHINAKDYLEAKTNQKRRSILSKIVYSNSSLGFFVCLILIVFFNQLVMYQYYMERQKSSHYKPKNSQRHQ